MNVMDSIALLTPEFVLLFSLLALMLFDRMLRAQRERLTLYALAGVTLALAASAEAWNLPPHGLFAGALADDSLAQFGRLLVLCGAAVSLVLTLGRFTFAPPRPHLASQPRHGEFGLLVLLAALGACLLVASRDLIVTVIALEMTSLPLYALLTFAESRAGHEAAAKYFLLGAASTAVMVFGISFLTGPTATTRYAPLDPRDPFILLGLILFLAGLFFKVAVVPFHAWQPDSYQAAPLPAAVFLATSIKTAAVLALVRLIADVLPLPAALPDPLVRILVIVSALTMLLGNGAALAQSSVKRLLGYSAIAHTGFLLVGVVATGHTGNPAGIAAALLYLMAYLPAIVAALAVVAVVEKDAADINPYRTGDDGVARLAGLARRRPLLAAAFIGACASLAGLPPFFGFWGKFEVFRSVFQAGQYSFLAVGLFCMIYGVVYYVRLIRAVFVPETPASEPIAADGGGAAAIVLAIIASAILVGCGIMPGAMLKLAVHAVQGILF